MKNAECRMQKKTTMNPDLVVAAVITLGLLVWAACVWRIGK
jgi:preprotein translocase subunit Sec61beta